MKRGVIVRLCAMIGSIVLGSTLCLIPVAGPFLAIPGGFLGALIGDVMGTRLANKLLKVPGCGCNNN